MLKAIFDEQLGIIRSISSGMTPPDELEIYVEQLRTLRQQQRARIGRFLHLVDAKDSALQTQWAAERPIRHNGSAGDMKPDDKTAVVLNSALLRMQAARLANRTQFATFTDMDEAVAWLIA
ncbi:MAG TPA: hypothetical protein VF503_20460 [Sphingobium sp.]|uniref:hypothetical protein n=1 Tax=Sphingobium sp. TaxID=1912891 RepID=UPI002ED4BB15